MSGGMRGRALIISNKYSSCLRRGAEQDFINLKRMFESSHFDVVGEHKDYTAQVSISYMMQILLSLVFVVHIHHGHKQYKQTQ